MTRSTPRHRIACIALVAAFGPAAAAPAAPSAESVARDALMDALAPALEARGGTVLATVAPPDARRAPPPCAQLTGFVPPGARLSGRTLVGVRCADGTAWQTFVAAEVRVDAPVWQATRALKAGEPLATGDVVLAAMPLTPADVDAALAAARGSVARGSAGLATIDGRQPAPLGRVLLRPVGAGRALTASDLRDEGRLNAGETVKVVYQGDGFSVSSEGRTTGPADPGSAVQIRLASGGLVSGTLRADHLVELPR